MADYLDYRPTSRITIGRDGKEVTREIYIKADSEIDAMYHQDCPVVGELLDAGWGSIPEYLYCSDIRINQIENSGDSGGYLFSIVATYRRLSRETPVADKAIWRVSFRPMQINLRNVKNVSDQTRYGPDYGSSPPPYPEVKTGINVTTEGPQGVDVDIMTEVLSIDFFKSEASAETFIPVARDLVNKVNNADFSGPWGTYAKGEARITGMEISRTNNDLISISIEVSRLPNETLDVYLDSLGSTVEIEKEGWQYLWVRFLRSMDSDNNDVRPMSIDAYVATVYEYGDFSNLGIDDNIWI